MPSLLRSGLLALAAILWSHAGLCQVLQSFPVAYPTGLILGPDGAIWSVDGIVGTFIRIENGATREFRTTQKYVLSMAAGPDGNIWFTSESGIGKMTTGGVVTVFNYPNAWPLSIITGPDGAMWFTDFNANRIGRITTAGRITWFDVPTASAGVADITAGLDGNLWFIESLGINQIGRISTTGVVTEFRLPEQHRPQYITAGMDGNVWFAASVVSDWGGATVGRITPGGEIAEFPLPSGATSIVAAPDGRVWLGGYGMLMRVSPGGAVARIPLPQDHRAREFVFPNDGTIWFAGGGEHFSEVPGAVVQFCADGSACVTSDALLLRNGRFALTVDWKDHTGTSGRGMGVRLSESSAYFWFFDPSNVEMVVKILDGCAVNHRFWTFAAGMTDVEVIMTVTDTRSGVKKTYVNPQATPFAPIQDAAAFSSCR